MASNTGFTFVRKDWRNQITESLIFIDLVRRVEPFHLPSMSVIIYPELLGLCALVEHQQRAHVLRMQTAG